MSFRQSNFGVFDIETTEEINEDDSREQAILTVLSISFISSIDQEPLFFIRKGDSLEDCKDLVRRFLSCVEQKASEFKTKFPERFTDSLNLILKTEAERRKIWAQKRAEGIPADENKLELFPASWKNWLRSMATYRIYGFNSARFDTRVLAPQMFDVILDDLDNEPRMKGSKKPKFNVLKESSNIFRNFGGQNVDS